MQQAQDLLRPLALALAPIEELAAAGKRDGLMLSPNTAEAIAAELEAAGMHFLAGVVLERVLSHALHDPAFDDSTEPVGLDTPARRRAARERVARLRTSVPLAAERHLYTAVLDLLATMADAYAARWSEGAEASPAAEVAA
jgi:hypothetical protein